MDSNVNKNLPMSILPYLSKKLNQVMPWLPSKVNLKWFPTMSIPKPSFLIVRDNMGYIKWQ